MSVERRGRGSDEALIVRMMRFLVRHRSGVQAGVDAGAWFLALWLATLLRYDFTVSTHEINGLAAAIPIAIASQVLAGLVFGLYTGRWRYGSFEEVAALAMTSMFAVVVLSTVNYLWYPRLIPMSVPVAAGLVALVLTGGARYGWRFGLERRRRPQGEGCERLLVFGAGDGAARVITELLGDPDSPYLPVALLDDDPAKRKLRIMGVPVVGGRSQLAVAAGQYRAETLLIAIPSADAVLVKELTELGRAAELKVKVLPPVRELFQGEVGVDDIRDVSAADLLGRHEIETDVASIAGYLTGKRVLVTGAGGSIGSELCRQINRYAVSRLIMLDRDESALHGVELSLQGRALLDSPDVVLADLRDRAAIAQALATHRPHVVFHAAALKHLPLLERHPAEAVKTNVWGTLDLLELCSTFDVERFVNISTDKAADPCNVLGYTKRITEKLTSFFSLSASGTYLSVRFGNVLGSRGSMLTTFQAQVERGGPVTVTHKDVTRFFMTVEEAVQLVIQAGAIGSSGEVLVLDMGNPVRISEVATLLAERSERPIAIEYTGLRPGEKLHEALLGSGELDRRPVHPLISHVGVLPLDPEEARAIDCLADKDAIVEALCKLVDLQAAEPRGR